MKREELIEMLDILKEQAKLHRPDEEILTDIKAESFIFVMDEVIKALGKEGEGMNDLISRQSAIYAISHAQVNFDVESEIDFTKYKREVHEIVAGVLDAQEKALKDLPSVNPQEPKTGRWEWVQYDSNPNIGNWHCSECRTIIPHMPEKTDNTPIYKWCPMCGAKMVKPQESEG